MKDFLIPIIIILIAVALSFIIPVFAETHVTLSHWLWIGTSEYYHQVAVWESDNVPDTCDHAMANACINEKGIIVPKDGAHNWNRKGCTHQTHEWLHLMGLSEREIPVGCLGYGK